MRLSRTVRLLLAFAFVFFVLYPDPGLLVRSVRHTVHPVVDPAAVQALAATLPNDPKLIEQAVLTRVVPYSYDWQTSGVPWYFPTTREAVSAGRGDCESRAVVLASILAAKHIPYQLKMSFDHIWVQYPGKQANALENNGVVLASQQHGHFVLRWPKDLHVGQEIKDNVAIFWTPMPLYRKLLLVGGLALIVCLNGVIRLVRAAARRATGRSPARAASEA